MKKELWVCLPLLGVLLLASTALAQVPSPADCDIPAFIDVVGTSGGVPDPAGSFPIIIRDLAHNPIPGAVVTLSFGDCSDMRLAMVQSPGITLSCDGKTLTGTTDATGQVRFTVVGACSLTCANGGLVAAGPTAACVRVCADGVFIGTMKEAVYDLDGAALGDGLNPADLHQVRQAIIDISVGRPYRPRMDYNHNGTINGTDYSFYTQQIYQRSLPGAGSHDGSGGAGYCTSSPTTSTCP